MRKVTVADVQRDINVMVARARQEGRMEGVDATIKHIAKMGLQPLKAQPTSAKAAPKRTHWTQKPENAKKVRAVVRKMNAARR